MRLKVRNLGPIGVGYEANGGFIVLEKITLLCGPQSTGKSTIVKLFSTLAWIEKALMRGDFTSRYVEQYNRFVNKFCKDQNISNYFKPDTEILFEDEACRFSFRNGHFRVDRLDPDAYEKRQIVYIPAERNILAAIEHAENIRRIPSSLTWLQKDLERALQRISGAVDLPIENVRLVYDKQNKLAHIKPQRDDGWYRIRLAEASSGIQSSVPLYIVLRDLTDHLGDPRENATKKESLAIQERIRTLLEDDSLSMQTRKQLIEQLSDSSNKSLLAIVEEPEQNLYPKSQRDLLYNLIGLNNRVEDNRLLMTTHSPYMLDYLTLAVKACQVAQRRGGSAYHDQISNIVPMYAWTKSEDVAIYQIDESGRIERLGTYNGLPLDSNRLNTQLAETNEMFDSLMDIEEAD